MGYIPNLVFLHRHGLEVESLVESLVGSLMRCPDALWNGDHVDNLSWCGSRKVYLVDSYSVDAPLDSGVDHLINPLLGDVVGVVTDIDCNWHVSILFHAVDKRPTCRVGEGRYVFADFVLLAVSFLKGGALFIVQLEALLNPE